LLSLATVSRLLAKLTQSPKSLNSPSHLGTKLQGVVLLGQLLPTVMPRSIVVASLIFLFPLWCRKINLSWGFHEQTESKGPPINAIMGTLKWIKITCASGWNKSSTWLKFQPTPK
jgi:hypothetical protein